jgi:putative restriction endonuclease
MLNFENEIEKLKVNKVGSVISLHKPLLLLLTISEIVHGHKNEFVFDEIESTLSYLISKYGLKNTSRINPQYPFIYLASSQNLWICSIDKSDLKHPDAASRKEVQGSIGHFTSKFYEFLQNPHNAYQCINFILNQYWPEAYHEEILHDLGIYELNQSFTLVKSERSKKFVEEVLDAYERKCAICQQSIRLADTLIGIDACHVKPIQHFGDDNISNGIALCKVHHWALDRGAISISKEMNLLVSKKLNGNGLFDYFTSFEDIPIFIPRKKEYALSTKNIDYHANYIFVK